MASFKERSISNKIDSSNAETNVNSKQNRIGKIQFSPLNGEFNEFHVNNSQLTMANKLSPTSSTMDNVIDPNSVRIESSTSTVERNCISMNDYAEAETIVSSTEHTTVEPNDNPNGAVNKNYAIDVKSPLPKSSSDEYRKGTQSHVAIVSTASNQNKCEANASQQHNNSMDKTKSNDKGRNNQKHILFDLINLISANILL